MTVKIGCIVEGQGDVVTVPLLIRRIAAELYPELAIDTPRPIRVHRNQVVQPNELEQEVKLAAQKISNQGQYLFSLIAMRTVQQSWDRLCFIGRYQFVLICQLLSCLPNTSSRRGFLQQPSPFADEEG